MPVLRSWWPLIVFAAACSGEIGDGTPPVAENGRRIDRGASEGEERTDPKATQGAAGTCLERIIAPLPMRRLTRAEYDRSVSDLLGAKVSLADRFPPDEKLDGFAGNTSEGVTDLHVDQYIAAAEAAAELALTRADDLLGCEASESACVTRFIERLGKRAFRRPLSPEEVATYVSLYEAEGDLEGVRLVVEAILESPHFLYVVEDRASSVAPGPLTGYEVAARLALFLWKSVPDERLLGRAEDGSLATRDGIVSEARRMLADPRAEFVLDDFHAQWLGLERLAELEKDENVYPTFTPELRASMLEETRRFIRHVFSEEGGGRLSTLLTARYSFLDDELADHYGVTAPEDPFGRAPLDAEERAGILTHASVLAAHGTAVQSAPVHRGKLIREQLLCSPLPNPPPGIEVNDPVPEPGVPRRRQFEQHRTDPACAGCHQLVDPIGFGFEHYDGIGAFRTEDGGEPVDARGELVGTSDADGDFVGAVELVERLEASEQVRRCMVSKWFTYAIGRPRADEDRCDLERTYEAFAATGYDLRALLVEIAATDAFRYRSGGSR